MDFMGRLSEVAEAPEVKRESSGGFSREALEKFDKLMGDDKIFSETGHPAAQLHSEVIQSDLGENESSKERMENNETAENKNVTKELTQDEINEKQKQAIKEAFTRIVRGEQLADAEKGNLGEMLMDQYYISQGYMPIHHPRVTDLEHKSGQGIDGVYEKTNPDGTQFYVIADAKVNYARLSKGLADGTDQMSDVWIDKRLDNAVGKEKADEIRDAYEDAPGSVSKEVYHYSYGDSGDGTSSADISTVDENGNLNQDKEVVQIFDKYGKQIDGGKRND